MLLLLLALLLLLDGRGGGPPLGELRALLLVAEGGLGGAPLLALLNLDDGEAPRKLLLKRSRRLPRVRVRVEAGQEIERAREQAG